MAFLIHGGPQGAWEDGWSTRWNPAVFANANTGEKGGDNVEEESDGMGWVVVAINPTGSTGYGQNFTDAIQGNWGTIPCNHPYPITCRLPRVTYPLAFVFLFWVF